jgi:hypothetical protein
VLDVAAIIGKKAGMTQVFQEDGTLVPVTVIEAGPCPVTAIRDPERDGYSAIQLGFGETKESRLTKAELGHLRKADAKPLRTLIEFRDEEERQVGDVVTVEDFEPGQRVKVSPRLQSGAGDTWLAQRPPPGLDRCQRGPGPRVQGGRDARPYGRAPGHRAPPGADRRGR